MSLGFRFNYWSHNESNDGYGYYDGKVRPKHDSLKSEMLNNPYFDSDEWDHVVHEALRLHQSNRARRLRVNEDDNEYAARYDMKNGDRISPYHFQCILLYSNYDINCFEFGKTLRRITESETVESVMARNGEYYFMSKGLAELVQLFGSTNSEENGPFYTGLNKPFLMKSFSVKFAGPTSTSKQLAVASNFAGPQGVLLILDNNTNRLAKCFDFSWCSQYANAEDERFFMASRRQLRMESVVFVKTSSVFTKYFAAMFKFDAMLSGGLISPLSVSKRDAKIIENLCVDQLSGSSLNSSDIPEYITQCFSMWCYRKEVIEIWIPDLPQQFQGLCGMIMENVVGVDDNGNAVGKELMERVNGMKSRIFKMFLNLKTVVISTRFRGPNQLHYPFSLEMFLEFMSELSSNIEYQIIAYSDDNGTATWLHQAVTKEVEQEFKEKGWKIKQVLKGKRQGLIIKNIH